MSFAESIKTCFSKYVKFSGRAPRSEFWWWQLFFFLALLISNFLDFQFGADSPLGLIIVGGIMLPGFAVAVRRLHDRNLSGLWFAPPVLIGIFLGVIGISGMILTLTTWVLLIYYLILYFPKGTEGPNRFGEDPLLLSGD
jgi:uncharacterized membrane protein YhaH (DUF805 family)